MSIRSQDVYSVLWLSNLITKITFLTENVYLLQWENIVNRKIFFFFDILVSLRCTMTKGNNRKSIPLKGRSSVPISKLTKGTDQGWVSMKSTKKGRAPMKPIKRGLASGNRGRAPVPIHNLLQGRLIPPPPLLKYYCALV